MTYDDDDYDDDYGENSNYDDGDDDDDDDDGKCNFSNEAGSGGEDSNEFGGLLKGVFFSFALESS